MGKTKRVYIEGTFKPYGKSYTYLVDKKLDSDFLAYLVKECGLNVNSFAKDVFFTKVNNGNFSINKVGYDFMDEGFFKEISCIIDPDYDEDIFSYYTTRESANLRNEREKLVNAFFLIKEKEQKINNKLNGGKVMTQNKFKIPGLKNVGSTLPNGTFAFSLITNQLAVKMDDSYFSFNKENKTLTDESGFVMEMPFPAMILPERFGKLKTGDLIFRDNKIVFVVDLDKENKTFTFVGSDGKVETAARVGNTLIKDLDFVEKIMNPFGDIFSSKKEGSEGFDGLFDNPMMLMAMMGNQGGKRFSFGEGNNDMMSMLMLSKMMKK